MKLNEELFLKFINLKEETWVNWSKELIRNGYLHERNLTIWKETWYTFAKFNLDEKLENKKLIEKLFDLLNLKPNKLDDKIFDINYLIRKKKELQNIKELKNKLKSNIKTKIPQINNTKIDINTTINNITIGEKKIEDNKIQNLPKNKKVIEAKVVEKSNKNTVKKVTKKITKKKVIKKTQIKKINLNSNKNYIDKLDNSFGTLRNGFSQGLVKSGRNKNVVALCADLTGSVKVDAFAKKYPTRFFEFGIAEQNMMSAAAGMCIDGKIPFVTSYAAFNPGRNWDQLRVSVAYQNSNVKILGGHAGLTTGPDGATHQALEDIAITRILPNLTVIVPCDEIETKKATLAIAKHKGPCYLRLSREKTLNITNNNTPFEIGKANVLDLGEDVTIIACGLTVQFALETRKKLFSKGIKASVINLHTIKPLDKKTILKYAKKTGCFVTIEEHQITGGMGSAVSEFLSQKFPIPIEMIGVNDSFGESGPGYELLKKYKISTNEIIKRVNKVLKRKKHKNIN